MKVQEARDMTPEQQKAHAEKVYATMQALPGIRLLIDIVKEERTRNPFNAPALDQWFMITSDLMGIHHERFEAIINDKL